MQELTPKIIRALLKAPITKDVSGNMGVSVKSGKYEWRLEHDARKDETFLCYWLNGFGSDVDIPNELEFVVTLLKELTWTAA